MATELRNFRAQLAALRDEITKSAFLPMPGDMPQQMQAPPQGDPNAAAAQGAPPQGGPPPQGMPPQGGPPPQGMPPGGDPAAMQQGMPPQDPGATPDMNQVIDQLAQGLEELFQVVQQLAQGQQALQATQTQTEQKIDIIVNELNQPPPAPAAMQQAPMQGDPNAAAAQMAGMAPQGDPSMQQMPPGMPMQ